MFPLSRLFLDLKIVKIHTFMVEERHVNVTNNQEEKCLSGVSVVVLVVNHVKS